MIENVCLIPKTNLQQSTAGVAGLDWHTDLKINRFVINSRQSSNITLGKLCRKTQ